MAKKTVRLVNYEGHQYDLSYGTIWSDTWARFRMKRKMVYIGPTLIGMEYLDRDRELFSEDPEFYGYREPDFPDGNWKFCLPFGENEDNVNIPTIAINAPLVTKEGIEGAIGWYIRQRFGVTAEMRFRWRNRKNKIFVSPL